MKKFLTALGAIYAAGVAFGLKKRQDDGTSKLKKGIFDSTLSEIIDEIVDMHSGAYDEIKKRIEPVFEEIHDFDSLKSHVGEMIDGFEKRWETTFEGLKNMSEEKKQELSGKFDGSKKHLENTLETAKERANNLKDTTQSTIEDWTKEAQLKIQEFYKKAQSYFEGKEKDNNSKTK